MDENIIIGILTVVVIILAVCVFRNYMGTEPYNSGAGVGVTKIGFKYQTNNKDVIDFMNICQPAITSFASKNKHIVIDKITKEIRTLRTMDENAWQQWQARELPHAGKCMTEAELLKDPQFNMDQYVSPAMRQLIIDIVKYCSAWLCTNGKIDRHKLIYLLVKVRACLYSI